MIYDMIRWDPLGSIVILYYLEQQEESSVSACIRATLVFTATRHSGSKFTLPSHQ